MLIAYLSAQNTGRPAVGPVRVAADDVFFDSARSITLRQEDEQTGGYARSFSDNITFYGEAWALIKAELIDAPNARDNSVTVELYDDCCGEEVKVFRGTISATDLDWCEIDNGQPGECAYSVTATEEDVSSEQENCIRSKIVTANHTWPDGTDFWYRDHPYVQYCNELRPSALQILVFIFGGLLAFVSFVVFLVVDIIFTIINAILSVLNSIASFIGFGGAIPDPIDLDPNVPGNQGLLRTVLQDEMAKIISGCGFGHPAPLARDYIMNVCYQCGLTGFDSSILNNSQNDYYNLVVFQAPSKEGRRDPLYDTSAALDKDVADTYFDYNAQNDTGGAFLDNLALLFNAEWYIKDNRLHFEQEDLDYTLWTDLTLPENRENIQSLCFEYTDELPPRGLSLKYSVDGFDGVGNEAKFLYDDIVPFDQPPNPNLGPLESIDFLYGTSRFRDDQIDADKLSTWSGFFDVIKIITAGLVDVNTVDFQNVLLLQRGACSIPKLLILEENWRKENAKVIRVTRGASSLPYAENTAQVYNYPMWFAARHYGGQYANSDPVDTRKYAEFGNLFQFWRNRDPRNFDARRGIEFRLEMDKACQTYQPLLQLITDRNLRLSIILPFQGQPVMGYVREIQVGADTYTISGTL